MLDEIILDICLLKTMFAKVTKTQTVALKLILSASSATTLYSSLIRLKLWRVSCGLVSLNRRLSLIKVYKLLLEHVSNKINAGDMEPKTQSSNRKHANDFLVTMNGKALQQKDSFRFAGVEISRDPCRSRSICTYFQYISMASVPLNFHLSFLSLRGHFE